MRRQRFSNSNQERDDVNSDLVYGRWPVIEALKAGPVAKIMFADNIKGEGVDEIMKLAREKKVPFHYVDRRKLEQMVQGNHQGVVAQAAALRRVEMVEVWEAARSESKGPCVLFLDGITDPQNLGSILRSAVFFGVPGVVIPKWRAASITGSVVRASAGAARLIKIAQVSNLVNAMEEARKRGIWLVGADMNGDDAKKADVPRPFALVMGSEGEGLHQLVRKSCDLVVRIAGNPVARGVDSLNVGVATGILLHQFA